MLVSCFDARRTHTHGGTCSGPLQPPCITSKRAHSPVPLKTPTQKGTACPALPQNPLSQSCGDSVARPLGKNDLPLHRPDT